MKNLINDAQLSSISDFIETEILKRGFNVKIKEIVASTNPNSKNTGKIVFYTENFQTTPVLFKAIQINNFGTSVKKYMLERDDKSKIDCVDIWVNVYVSYEHFDGGTNGCALFNFQGRFFEEEDRMHLLKLS